MGTRSTVKFYENDQNILSVYQHYDGYPSGVGRQIVNLFEKYTLVNGLGLNEERKVANGFSDLALFYILDNKTDSGNLYATTVNNSQEYDYEIYTYSVNKNPIHIKVYNYKRLIFEGSLDEFISFVEDDE